MQEKQTKIKNKEAKLIIITVIIYLLETTTKVLSYSKKINLKFYLSLMDYSMEYVSIRCDRSISKESEPETDGISQLFSSIQFQDYSSFDIQFDICFSFHANTSTRDEFLQPDMNLLGESLPWYSKAALTKVNYEAFIRKHAVFVRKKDFRAALECCYQMLELKPTCIDCHFKLVITLTNLKRYEEAYAHLSEQNLLDKFFDSIDYFELKLLILFVSKNFHRAVHYLSHLIQSQQTNNDVLYYHKSIFLFKLKEYTESLESFRHVEPLKLNCHNDMLVFFFIKGRVLNELNQYEEAILCFKRAKIDDYRTHFHIGIALIKLKRFRECIQSFNEAIKWNSLYHQAYYYKGCALKKLKEYSQAIDLFDKAISLNPKLSEAFKWKGICLINLEKFKESIVCFDKYIKLERENHLGFYLKGFSFYSLEKFVLAYECLSRSIELKTDFKPAHNLKIAAANDLFIYELILSELGMEMRLEKRKQVKYLYKGLAYCIINDFKSAIVFFDKSLQISQDFTIVLFAKANALYKLDQFAAAETCIEKLVKLGLTCYRTYFLRARILNSLGKSTDAVASYDRSVKYLMFGNDDQNLNDYHFVLEKLDTLFNINCENIFEECVKFALNSNMHGVALKNVNQYISYFKDKNARSFYLKGIVFSKLKNFRKAIEYFNKCILLDDKFSVAYYEIAMCLLMVSTKIDFHSVFNNFQKANEIDPKLQNASLLKEFLNEMLNSTHSVDEIREKIKKVTKVPKIAKKQLTSKANFF